MQKTKIGYLTHTWNPIAMRCTPVSEGCKNCWHIKMAKRLAHMPFKDTRAAAYNPGIAPMLLENELEAPLRLKKPARIGVQFMGDLFHESVPGQWAIDIFLMAEDTPQHKFIFLTKRPQRMREIFSHVYAHRWQPPSNIWLGVSVEDQKTADERIPLLLQTPAAKRFVSYEPALGPVDFHKWFWEGKQVCPCTVNGLAEYDYELREEGLDWVIMGGESGPGARPMHPDWARSVRDQCQAAGVPFFFKQWGEWIPRGSFWRILPLGSRFPKRMKSEYFGERTIKNRVFKCGAKYDVRRLDGKEYSEMPK